MQTNLSLLINAGVHLSQGRKESLFELLAKGTREETRKRLHRRIFNTPITLWSNWVIYERVHFNGDEVDYCAGQSYPDEIRRIRKLILEG